ncbi:MAG: DUF4402 domain-containing protein [Geothrix sp.]|uniref:DUF4402 domain-containing protein n=1 Tax=Geothrix sp. TaxID=1962974 RepID=UPI003BB1C350
MNKLILLSSIVAFGSMGLVAQDGSVSTASAKASVTIVNPLKVANTRGMWFGEYIVDPALPTPKKLILEEYTDGTPYTNFMGVQKWGNKSGLGEPHTARFTATGEKDYAFLVTTPKTITLTSGEGTGTLNLTVQVCDSSSVTNPAGDHNWSIGTFTQSPFGGSLGGSTGAAQFYVGGELDLGANSAPGLYRGTFSVDVQYN